MLTFRLIALVTGIAATAQVAAAPDDLDPSFGVGGVVLTEIGPPQTHNLSPTSMLQPDGKLIIVGTVSQTSLLVRRYNVDGSSDLSFGVNGSALLPFDVVFGNGAVGDDSPRAVALLPDGRFLIAGESVANCDFDPGFCEQVFVMARFNADGALDSTFGTNGKVTGGGQAMAVLNDGKILTLVNRSNRFAQQPPLLQRYNVDGSQDANFNPAIGCVGGGTFRLAPDGKIVVVMTADFAPNNSGFCITRLNADGTPDDSFGMQGVAVVDTGASAVLVDFFIDASGKITVAGSAPAPVVFRLLPDGSLDSGFGSDGSTPVPALQYIEAIARDCHGRMIVAGSPNNPGNFAIGRLLSDGSIDQTFAVRSPSAVSISQLLVRPAGPILAIGFPTLAEYIGDQPCNTVTAVEYYYADWNYYFETAFPNEIAALDGGAFGGVWQRTGETFNIWPEPNSSAQQTCRYFSTAFAPKSSHFYSPYPTECAVLKTNPDWEFEAIAFYIQLPNPNGLCSAGTVPLYRLYNNGMGGAPNHRYTTSLAIFNQMIAHGWVFEGDASTQVFACVPQ